jgi:aspartyl/asparaginyl beta-hydroxylase (cupin superfamily)
MRIIVIFMISFLILVYTLVITSQISSPANNFYDWRDMYPELGLLHRNMKKIRDETIRADTNDWEIFPLFGYGVWAQENCKIVPGIVDILNRIPNIRTAMIRRLVTRKVNSGYASLTNTIFRCYYGIFDCTGSFLEIDGQKKSFQNNNVLVYDCSKPHRYNISKKRTPVVLVLDIQRPWNIPEGVEKEENLEELYDWVRAYRKNVKNPHEIEFLIPEKKGKSILEYKIEQVKKSLELYVNT